MDTYTAQNGTIYKNGEPHVTGLDPKLAEEIAEALNAQAKAKAEAEAAQAEQ